MIQACKLLGKTTLKQKLFSTMDRIDQLKNTPFELSESDELELRNLEVVKMNQWSDWKFQDE